MRVEGDFSHKVLCTNGLLSKTLAVVRSLGSRGIPVLVGEKIRWHASGFSRFAAKSLLYPDPQGEPERFFKWLKQTIVREECGLLLPMDDDTMRIAVANQGELKRLCVLPVPSVECYEMALDKAKTVRLAKRVGVPCPRTVELSEGSESLASDLRQITRSMDFPLVIKPRLSSGSRGIRVVEEKTQFLDAYMEVHTRYSYPLVQEYIPPGSKYDVCLCYNEGHQLTGAFAQREVRNFPLQRGPSTVHESVCAPDLLELSQRLMEALPWHGVVDVEFMIDPRSRQPVLMEINPRFWSSLHLAIRCGVDFPYMLYQMGIGAGGKEEPFGSYLPGVRGRALLPGDILHFLSNPRRFEMDPPIWTTKLYDDTLSLSDPAPTLGFLLSALHYLFDKKMRQFVLRR